jgi:hypothetical protein
MVTAAGEPVVDAKTPPRRMFGEALDVPLPVTTLCNGAMVDVIEQPVELVVTDTDQRKGSGRRSPPR